MTKVVVVLLTLAAAVPAVAQQIPDTIFSPPIAVAAFDPGRGPTVLIDAGHLNFHTAEGGYQTFARLIRRDGYVIRSNHDAFSAQSLEGTDVLVVVNAMHPQSEADWAPLPNFPAFTDDEVDAVEKWVRDGGSLLLIADHMPLAAHSANLAAAFGIRFQNGFALNSEGSGRVVYRRSDGSLPSTAFSDGRSGEERVDSVTAFTGQAFRLDPTTDAEAALLLPPDYTLLLPQIAWEFSDSTPRVPGAICYKGHYYVTAEAASPCLVRRLCLLHN